MKHLGIDYGTKKVGIALSDSEGKIAFPKTILKNDETLMENLRAMIEEEGVEKIVIGKSLTLDGRENEVQHSIEQFKEELAQAFPSIPIGEQDERMSSLAANSFLFGKGNLERKRTSEREKRMRNSADDARAATIILQRYLDRKK